MDSVFISSIQRSFGDVREAAARAVDSYGLHPVVAERAGASADNAQRALLDEVRNAEIFLLIIGSVYGDRGESGFSPTEDEFNEAARLNKPILVLKQNVNLEPDQEEFLSRLRGSWERGLLTGHFDSAADVGNEVVRALRTLEGPRAIPSQEDKQAAAERAAVLARGPENRGYVTSGSKARIAIATVGAPRLLEATDLENKVLIDSLLGLARSKSLVSNASSLTQSVTAAGIEFEAKTEGSWEELQFFVGSDGSIVAEGAVAGDARHFGSSMVMSSRLADLIGRGQGFALAIWEEMDKGHDVRDIAVTVGIPEAQNKVFSDVEAGNSISMPMGLPEVVVAPNPPREVRREELGSDAITQTLVAEVRRKFADAGAVHSP